MRWPGDLMLRVGRVLGLVQAVGEGIWLGLKAGRGVGLAGLACWLLARWSFANGKWQGEGVSVIGARAVVQLMQVVVQPGNDRWITVAR